MTVLHRTVKSRPHHTRSCEVTNTLRATELRRSVSKQVAIAFITTPRALLPIFGPKAWDNLVVREGVYDELLHVF